MLLSTEKIYPALFRSLRTVQLLSTSYFSYRLTPFVWLRLHLVRCSPLLSLQRSHRMATIVYAMHHLFLDYTSVLAKTVVCCRLTFSCNAYLFFSPASRPSRCVSTLHCWYSRLVPFAPHFAHTSLHLLTSPCHARLVHE